MSYKINIAKDTFDAITETDPNNLVFSSDFNTLKYYTSGTIVLPVTAFPFEFEFMSTSTLTHSLGFYPFYVVYVKDDLMSDYQPVGRVQLGSGATRSYFAYVTTSGLTVIARGNAGSGGESYNATFKYKLFKNSIGL